MATPRARSSPWRSSEAPISSSSALAVAPDSPGSSSAASPETSCPAAPRRCSSSATQRRNQLKAGLRRVDRPVRRRGPRHERRWRQTMNQRRILVAYDGTEEAYWALMQAADAALAKGAAIGVVTVLPTIAAAATDAAAILREHELE